MLLSLIISSFVLCQGLNRRGNALVFGAQGPTVDRAEESNITPESDGEEESLNFEEYANAIPIVENGEQPAYEGDDVMALPIPAGFHVAPLPPSSDDMFEQDPYTDNRYRFIRDLAKVGWRHNGIRRILEPMDQSKMLTIVISFLSR
jgi:hypothetical protein